MAVPGPSADNRLSTGSGTACGSSDGPVAVSPDGSRIYVSNYWSNTVSVVDTATNTVVRTFAVQPFQAALRSVPRDLLDAGAALGAKPQRVFWRLHAPLAWRGIAAGLTLGFAHTLGEFGVVLMIGGSIPGVTKVASIALYDEVQTLAYPQAHAFAATLLVLSFVLLLVVTLLQRRQR